MFSTQYINGLPFEVAVDDGMVCVRRHDYEVVVSEAGFKRWREGELIQNVFPNLKPDDREFLISGMTPKEWEAMFGTEEYCE